MIQSTPDLGLPTKSCSQDANFQKVSKNRQYNVILQFRNSLAKEIVKFNNVNNLEGRIRKDREIIKVKYRSLGELTLTACHSNKDRVIPLKYSNYGWIEGVKYIVTPTESLPNPQKVIKNSDNL